MAPTPITSEGVVLAAKAAVRDDTSVLGRSGNRWALYPIDGGEPRSQCRRSPPATSQFGGAIGVRPFIVVDNANGPGNPGRPAVDVVRVDIGSGRRTRWKTLRPADPVGVEVDRAIDRDLSRMDERTATPSSRRLGDLFVADGLK